MIKAASPFLLEWAVSMVKVLGTYTLYLENYAISDRDLSNDAERVSEKKRKRSANYKGVVFI